MTPAPDLPPDLTPDAGAFLQDLHPYDALPAADRARLASVCTVQQAAPGSLLFRQGDPLAGLWLIMAGTVEIADDRGAVLSILGPGNSFGERGLLRDGRAASTARVPADAAGPARLLLLPAAEFHRLRGSDPGFARFYSRGAQAGGLRRGDLAVQKVADLMASPAQVIAPETAVAQAARAMRDAGVSSLAVTEGGQPDGALRGIVTTRDMTARVLAEGRDPQTPVAAVMTAAPVCVAPGDLGADVLHLMLDRRLGHLPVVDGDRLLGMVTQTDLIRHQAGAAGLLLRDLAAAETPAALAAATARLPRLLVQLVAAHTPHEVATRLISDVADGATRRLIALAEAQLGPAPVPYVWAACGSQGRQEQTGVSDQDNCLIIDDRATDRDLDWFAQLAARVCAGLADCGYALCPGQMMATNPRWRVRLAHWCDYFAGWIARPDPEAQMLASVMFDLRAVAGDAGLLGRLQSETLNLAAETPVFVAHMIANSLLHSPPLGLLRGIATIRSGEHRNQIDLKHNGVVPVIDLGRVYALIGALPAVNTRARILAAGVQGVISAQGAQDLVAAYDLIAQTRLDHQTRAIRAGRAPDNYLAPADLADFDRSHLRDAFVVVRTMQSAIGAARGLRV